MIDAKKEKFEPFDLFGELVLFTEGRIDPKTVPEGLHHYSLRHGDDDMEPVTVEHHVSVNHFGDILSKKVIPLSKKKENRAGDNYALIRGGDDWGFMSDMDLMTVEKYLAYTEEEPMSDSRKIALFHKMLAYFVKLYSGNNITAEELYLHLAEEFGMTEEELHDCGIYFLDEFFGEDEE